MKLTVRQLIEQLSKLPADALVATLDIEGTEAWLLGGHPVDLATEEDLAWLRDEQECDLKPGQQVVFLKTEH